MKILAIDDEAEIEPLSEQRFRWKILPGQEEFAFAYLDKEAQFYLRQYLPDIDTNPLADEYLRLSFLKLKPKIKILMALTTDFDASLGKVEVVPKDLKGYSGELKVENKEGSRLSLPSFFHPITKFRKDILLD